jgi:hypothetical protein
MFALILRLLQGRASRAAVERGVNRSNAAPHRDGTTYVILEPLDCLPRLAALVPPCFDRMLGHRWRSFYRASG